MKHELHIPVMEFLAEGGDLKKGREVFKYLLYGGLKKWVPSGIVSELVWTDDHYVVELEGGKRDEVGNLFILVEVQPIYK